MSDLVPKRQQLARRIVAAINAFENALDGLAAVHAAVDEAEILFEDTDFADDDDLKHLTAEIITAAIHEFAEDESGSIAKFMLDNAKNPIMAKVQST